MKKRIRYIINPKSGTKGKNLFPRFIEQFTDQTLFDFEIVFTKAKGHATELSNEASQKEYDIVVAVGGDGSVNETAKGLIGSNTQLGVIPAGSGNGMARHLKIPLDIQRAIQTLQHGNKEVIDTFRINDELCIGTFGIGFDAHIAHMFAKAGKRGYSTYAKLVLTEFYKYKPKTYDFTLDGKSFSKECFLLTFANSSQFGNDAVIAPFANVMDGILDISMIRKFPGIVVPGLIYRLMNGSINNSKYFEMLKGKDVVVRNSSNLHGHIDGEPVTFNSDLHIKIIPKSLTIIVP